MWRHVASNAITFLIVVLFLAAGAVTWGVARYDAEGPLTQAICLRVEAGSNMRAVSQTLDAEGAIASPAIFRLGADYGGRADDLKAGSFLIEPGTSMSGIMDIVTRGGANTCGTEVVYSIGVTRTVARVRELDPATNEYVEVARYEPLTEEEPAEFAAVRAEADTRYFVQVVEGTTVWQVVTALNGLDILEGEIPTPPAEGMIAPDRYEVIPGSRVAALLAQMVTAQEAILAAAWDARSEGLPLQSPEEALILASIIEKETSLPAERGQVASVFVNRLEQGMRLQTDPTVIYGVTNGQGVLGRGLRASELREETPWNTYVIDGLPPTPIANPGRASIEAALNPDETDYVFFVARTLTPADGHVFAETLDEQNRNVAAYRALEDAAAAAAAAGDGTGAEPAVD